MTNWVSDRLTDEFDVSDAWERASSCNVEEDVILAIGITNEGDLMSIS